MPVSSLPSLRTKSAQSSGIISGLDGLRAIAVVMVLVFHLFPAVLPGGFFGVDVFFVISGFLITTLLIREREKTGKIRLASFWARRARRLLPALVLMLLVCVSLALFVGGDVLVGLPAQAAGALLFVSNWVFIARGTDYFQQDNPELLRNTWSLGIEEQFYVLLPLVLLVLLRIARRGTRSLILACLGFASALVMLILSVAGADTTRIYFGTDSHLFGLLFGAAIAVLLAHRPTDRPSVFAQLGLLFGTFAGLLGLLVLALTIEEGSAASFEWGFVAAVTAALVAVICSTRPGSWAGRALDNPAMRWVGTRSYGIYLWHWPLFVLTSQLFQSRGVWWKELTVGGIVLILTVLIAHASYEYVEQPIRRLGLLRALRHAVKPWTLSPRSRAITAAVAGLIVVTVPAATIALATAPTKSSAEIAIERGAASLKEHEGAQSQDANQSESDGPGSSSEAQDEQKDQAAAEKTPTQGVDAPVIPEGTQVTAIGDSVMLASTPELNEALPGMAIDAAVSRGLGAGVQIARDQGAQLRPVLVVGLGTNGPIQVEDLDALRAMDPSRKIVLVNAHAERTWIPEVNSTLEAYAQKHRGVVLANWDAAIAAHPEYLAGDGIHPSPSGGKVYAQSVQEALKALSAPDESIGLSAPRY